MLAIYKELAETLMEAMAETKRGGHKHPHGPHHENKHHHARGRENMLGEALILYHLSSCENATPTEMSEKMGISTARMAAALNGLEHKGFVTREMDKVDRRKIIVSLTEQGKEFAQNDREERLLHMAKMLEALGEKDAREYVRIMKRLAEIKGVHVC